MKMLNVAYKNKAILTKLFLLCHKASFKLYFSSTNNLKTFEN